MTDETLTPQRPTRPQSVLWVLVATGISGIAGFVVTFAVAKVLGADLYAYFGVFWSGLFLIVGVLFGLQQESTRATAESLALADAVPAKSSLWIFGAAAGLIVGLVVFATSFWWAPAALTPDYADLSLQISIGSAFNAIVATMCGALAGAERWRLMAGTIVLDGLLRLLGVLVVLGVGGSTTALAWVVILPFPLSIAIIYLCAPRTLRMVSRSRLTYRELAVNSGHTVLAASATAVLINGFPLILAFFAKQGESATLGALIFAITLTRAPILVPMMALQSYLITRFTSHPDQIGKLIGKAAALIGAVMLLLAAITALWGQWALRTFMGAEYALPPEALVPLVVSSGFIGALCVTGPALLAQGRHRAYAAGWIVASIVALAALFVPAGIEFKAALALSAGPIAGLIVHFVALRAARRTSH
ncbi:lipopolysaccharide biosynthesis protein [Leifsonia sp. A12D58]|uniref:lipopolysaccharide biosynthesis protein n=1 Tax=Leifsonia sp. A12D58 TaxID=3397674 RepID=UPI0039DF35AE